MAVMKINTKKDRITNLHKLSEQELIDVRNRIDKEIITRRHHKPCRNVGTLHKFARFINRLGKTVLAKTDKALNRRHKPRYSARIVIPAIAEAVVWEP